MLDQIDLSINQVKTIIANKEAFDRLIKNPDYKLLIEAEYFLEEASRLVLMKADPAVQEELQQKQILGRMDGIGYLRQYMGEINAKGIQAISDMAELHNTREELLAEDLVN